jgi:regulator of protease activity HflC (stomatin/prohibitin superfamily)
MAQEEQTGGEMHAFLMLLEWAAILMGVVIFIVILLMILRITFVKQETVVVVRRLNRFHRAMKPRAMPHFTIARADKLQVIDLREQRLELSHTVFTGDGVEITVTITVGYKMPSDDDRLVDFLYRAADPIKLLVDEFQQCILKQVALLDVRSVLKSSATLQSAVRTELEQWAGNYGLTITTVTVPEIVPSDEVRAQLQSLFEAETLRLLASIEAQAHVLKEAGVAEAEADRVARMANAVLKQFGAMLASNDVKPDTALRLLHVAMMNAYARSDNGKVVVLPSDLTEAARVIGGIDLGGDLSKLAAALSAAMQEGDGSQP